MQIRKHFKREAMQHFVTQLFIAAQSDYSILTQSSNVGKFIVEQQSTAKRMSQVGEIGALGTSLDCNFIEASTHCCNFKLKTTGPYKTTQEKKCKVSSRPLILTCETLLCLYRSISGNLRCVCLATSRSTMLPLYSSLHIG